MAKRVLMANRPRLMRDLICGLVAQEEDLEVVGELYDERDLMAAVESLAPDVVVVGLDESNQPPAVCAALLAKRPSLRIIGLAAEKDLGVSFWADVQIRSRRFENSERGLLEAIRGSVTESTPEEGGGSANRN
ncbi:MAG TPA: hypothetical protein VNN17_09230 [Terriglobia bacterium]|nr:hypothetical protein [Terriglobia bacterium]